MPCPRFAHQRELVGAMKASRIAGSQRCDLTMWRRDEVNYRVAALLLLLTGLDAAVHT